jgi:putative endonuclease
MPRSSSVWFVYVARCADGTLYTGIARDVAARIAAHDAGRGARYTRGRGPLTVCAVRRCRTHGDALRLEAAIKRQRRAEKERLSHAWRLGVFARRLRSTAAARHLHHRVDRWHRCLHRHGER